MDRSPILTDKEVETILQHVESEYVRQSVLNKHLLELHKDTPVSIHIPRPQLQRACSQPSSYEVVRGKALLKKGNHPMNHIEVDCFIASGRWHLIDSSKSDELDIMQNLPQLLPEKSKRHIGLFTAQNGIQNSAQDFEKMCRLITSKLKREKPLFIGLHNPTSGKGIGVVNDLKRLRDEWTFNGPSLLMLRQLFTTLAFLLPQINPRLLWTHTAHSEGGLMTRKCLTDHRFGLTPESKGLIKNHLITLLYGGVSPVPDGACYQQINTYSNEDIALRLNTKYLDKLPIRGEALKDENLKQLAQQMADRAGSRMESIEEKLKKLMEGEYSLNQAMEPRRVKIGDPKKILTELQKGRERFYITEYPYKSKKNGCTLTIVESLLKKIPIIEGDHGFDGDTYQNALEGDFDEFRLAGLL